MNREESFLLLRSHILHPSTWDPMSYRVPSGAVGWGSSTGRTIGSRASAWP